MESFWDLRCQPLLAVLRTAYRRLAPWIVVEKLHSLVRKLIGTRPAIDFASDLQGRHRTVNGHYPYRTECDEQLAIPLKNHRQFGRRHGLKTFLCRAGGQARPACELSRHPEEFGVAASA